LVKRSKRSLFANDRTKLSVCTRWLHKT
uniref:Uncharacterized protein n=1 Tax=Ciona intestinalis TaxID=7719 RepID=H2XTM2_CIOIN